jgi:hypothetical protein
MSIAPCFWLPDGHTRTDREGQDDAHIDEPPSRHKSVLHYMGKFTDGPIVWKYDWLTEAKRAIHQEWVHAVYNSYRERDVRHGKKHKIKKYRPRQKMP